MEESAESRRSGGAHLRAPGGGARTPRSRLGSGGPGAGPRGGPLGAGWAAAGGREESPLAGHPGRRRGAPPTDHAGERDTGRGGRIRAGLVEICNLRYLDPASPRATAGYGKLHTKLLTRNRFRVVGFPGCDSFLLAYLYQAFFFLFFKRIDLF